MKLLRPISLALAVLALCTWSAASHACDQNKKKTTNATAASMKSSGAASSCSPTKATNAVTASATLKGSAKAHACTAEMAANCTAEMAAACATKGAKAAKFASHAKAADASAGCCMTKGAKASTVTASMPTVDAVVAGSEGCASHAAKASAVTAGAEGCAAHAMKTTAVTAGAEGCASHAKGKTTAMAAGANGSCDAKGTARTSGFTAHANCDGCADFNDCDQKLREMGAVLQVVSLKNGVMYVYTCDAAKVRSLQSTMAQRTDNMAMFASSDTGTHLCNACKQLRGAAKSGKLSREVVNIEGGCMTIMTSNDAAVVAKLHAMAGVATTRAKI